VAARLRTEGLRITKRKPIQGYGPRRWVTIMAANGARTKVGREPRRQMHNHAAWITVDDGITKRDCTVLDVSPGGARIATDIEFEIKDRLGLVLVPDRPKRQSCEVVWRRGNTYGIKFVL
jgi:hypothetical protein